MPEETASMELDTNTNSLDEIMNRAYENRNQTHEPLPISIQSQLTVSKKSTAIETRFKDSKIRGTPE